MKRKTLTENVRTVIERAKSKALPLEVSEVGLFSSLLFGKKNPGDADLYIEFDGTAKEGEMWYQKLEEFSDYLFDLAEGYKSTKQFIEPKGEGFIPKDKWKEEFLKRIKKKHKVEVLAENKDYRIIGLPFYNEEVKVRKEDFRQKFEGELKLKS